MRLARGEIHLIDAAGAFGQAAQKWSDGGSGRERKTRIGSRSERASASGCNSANTFRFPLGRTRLPPPPSPPPTSHPCEIRRATAGHAPCVVNDGAFLRFAEPENDGARALHVSFYEKGLGFAAGIISSAADRLKSADRSRARNVRARNARAHAPP